MLGEPLDPVQIILVSLLSVLSRFLYMYEIIFKFLPGSYFFLEILSLSFLILCDIVGGLTVFLINQDLLETD